MTRSLSSIINRLTLSSNGTQLETINNFSVVEPQLVMQASNSGYYQNDYTMMEKANLVAVSGCLNVAQNITNIPFSGCIPLIFGCLNSSQSWNLSLAPLQVQIDYNSVGVAFTQATGGVPTEFNVSSCQIVYENIQVEQNMLEAIKLEMAQVPYTIPFSSVMCFSKACEATCLYNIGVNFTSANGVFLTHAVPKTLAIIQKFKSNTQTDFSIYNDNQLVNTTGTLSVTDNISSVYCEMQRAFASLQDTQVTSAFSVGGLGVVSSISESDQFLTGISLNRFNESFNLSGTSVKQLTIGNSCTPSNGDISYIMITYSGYITIDQFGVVARYI